MASSYLCDPSTVKKNVNVSRAGVPVQHGTQRRLVGQAGIGAPIFPAKRRRVKTPPMVFRILVALTLAIVCTPPAWALTFALGNPASGAIKSGVGLVSGWVCDAEELEVSFDGGPRQFVPYGSERPDTAGVCGDTDNGFGLLTNYNELGDGPHTVALYIDGMVATQVNFNVVTLGTNFLRGRTGHGTITLSDGKQVDVQWEETTQGFTITGYSEGGAEGSDTGNPPPPTELLKIMGTWRFSFRLNGQTHTHEWTLDEIVIQKGQTDPIAKGYTVIGTLIVAGEGAKWNPNDDGRYQYFTFTHDGQWCYTHFFNLTTPTTAKGEFVFAPADPQTGDCGADSSPVPTTGTRVRAYGG